MGKNKKNKLPDFAKSRILVIGDVMLDQYIQGSTNRISPEAPVPVVQVEHTFFQPGGAGNVAMNLAALGSPATLIGLVGHDRHAGILRRILEESHIDGFLLETESPTITKVRVTSRSQQLLRMDYEQAFELETEDEKKFLEIIEFLIPHHDLVILSDYAKGTLSAKACRKAIKTAAREGVPVIVDPKYSDWSRYSGAYMITPNFGEFAQACGKPIPNAHAAVEKEGKTLIKQGKASYILVTRSDQGMSLITPSGTRHWEAEAREVYDVSGAGDTVIAVIGAALAAGLKLEDAATLANTAAGIVVGKSGTASVSPEELALAMNL